MQHYDTTFRVLAECSDGYIGVCTCCREFNFTYKTVLMSFQEEEMHTFFDWLIKNFKARAHYMPLRHGRNRVFSTPNSNLFLVFNDHELEEIECLYHQTLLLLQAETLFFKTAPIRTSCKTGNMKFNENSWRTKKTIPWQRHN